MFKSINYSRVVCDGCGAETTIEPGVSFSKLNCECECIKNDTKSHEISKPVMEEKDYIKSQTVTVIGRFKNGDYEVINSNDATDSWRVPQKTFESTYQEVAVNVIDLDESYQHPLSGKDADSIKDMFTDDELRSFAKDFGIRRYKQMNIDTLIDKLIEKAE